MAAAWRSSGFEAKLLGSPSQFCVAAWLRPVVDLTFLTRGSVWY